MSEKIKISIVIDDEKKNNASNGKCGKSVIVTHDSSMTLMSTLLKNNLMDGSFCGGRGDCGRCAVQFLEGAPLPTPLERSRLEPEELRQGFRLSCMARPRVDCSVRLAFAGETEISVVTEMMDMSEEIDLNSQLKRSSENRRADAMEFHLSETDDSEPVNIKTNVIKEERPVENREGMYVIAADLGTTTIAMQLRSMDTGEAVDTYFEMNPQRKYGADVLSRITACAEGHGEALRQCVWEALERGVRKFTEFVDVGKVGCVCVAGNTTMEHILAGHDVSSLGRSPFTPVEIGLQNCPGPLEIPLYITPGISAFVGGDIVAGLYALGMAPVTGERPGDVRLLIDLGTNGEMAMTDGRDMLVTATAAGPAFEGGAAGALVGTDMVAAAASLKERGILDETGLLAEPYFTEGVSVHGGKGDIRLQKEDIRALQMAKAAVRAGVEILWEQMGEPVIGQVYLAGGFGYYLDVEAAFAIGLLPGCMRGRVRAVGNTSLEGAFRIGRSLCRGMTDKRTLEAGISCAKSINLAQQKNFEELYLRYMNLCEN